MSKKKKPDLVTPIKLLHAFMLVIYVINILRWMWDKYMWTETNKSKRQNIALNKSKRQNININASLKIIWLISDFFFFFFPPRFLKHLFFTLYNYHVWCVEGPSLHRSRDKGLGFSTERIVIWLIMLTNIRPPLMCMDFECKRMHSMLGRLLKQK